MAGGQIGFFLNTTPANATTASFSAAQFPLAIFSQSIACGDLNGDSKPDLVLSEGAGPLLYVNTTPAGATTLTFTETAVATNLGGAATADFHLVDLNGDGIPDVEFAVPTSNAVVLMLNTTPIGATAATLAAPQTYLADQGVVALGVADINGDGKPDLLAVNTISSSTAAALAVPASSLSVIVQK